MIIVFKSHRNRAREKNAFLAALIFKNAHSCDLPFTTFLSIKLKMIRRKHNCRRNNYQEKTIIAFYESLQEH